MLSLHRFIALIFAASQAWFPAAFPTAPGDAASASTLVSRVSITAFTTRLPGNSFQAGGLGCPSSMTAIGGGFDVEYPGSMRVVLSAPMYGNTALSELGNGTHPAPSGWTTLVYNDGAAEGRYGEALICAPISGAVSVVTSATAPADSSAYVTVYCPAGTVALGGGVSAPDFTTMSITSSAPFYDNGDRLLQRSDGANPAPSGWWASVKNAHTWREYTFKVAAICAPATGITSVVASAPLAGYATASTKAVCPAGSFAIGGGTDVQNILSMRLTSSAPAFPGSARLYELGGGIYSAFEGWQGTAFNTTSTPGKMKTAVICAKTPLTSFIPIVTR